MESSTGRQRGRPKKRLVGCCDPLRRKKPVCLEEMTMMPKTRILVPKSQYYQESQNKDFSIKDEEIPLNSHEFTEEVIVSYNIDFHDQEAQSCDSVIVNESVSGVNIDILEHSSTLDAFFMDHSYCQFTGHQIENGNSLVGIPTDNAVNHSMASEAFHQFELSPANTFEVISCDLNNPCKMITCGDSDFRCLCKQVTKLPLVESKQFHVISTIKSLQIVQLYKNCLPAVKLAIEIDKDFYCTIHVHRKKLDDKHIVWKGLPNEFREIKDVKELLCRLELMNVCEGNRDLLNETVIDIGDFFSNSDRKLAYREGDFSAVDSSGLIYSSTIRSTKCKLLLDQSVKCRFCSSYGDATKLRIKKLYNKVNKKKDLNFTPFMNRRVLCQKIKEQSEEINELKTTLHLLLKQNVEKEHRAILDTKTTSTDEELELLQDNLSSNQPISAENILLDNKGGNEDTDDNIPKDKSNKINDKTENKHQPAKQATIISNGNSSNVTLMKNPAKKRKKSLEIGYCEEDSHMFKVNEWYEEECEKETYLERENGSSMNNSTQSVTDCQGDPTDSTESKNFRSGVLAKYVDSWKNLLSTWDSIAKNKGMLCQSNDTLISETNRQSRSTLCFICGKTFKTKGSLQDHISNIHPDPNNEIKCPECPKVFPSKKRFRNHIKVHLSPKHAQRFTCRICTKTFSLKATWRTHLQYMHNLKYMHNEGNTGPFE